MRKHLRIMPAADWWGCRRPQQATIHLNIHCRSERWWKLPTSVGREHTQQWSLLQPCCSTGENNSSNIYNIYNLTQMLLTVIWLKLLCRTNRRWVAWAFCAGAPAVLCFGAELMLSEHSLNVSFAFCLFHMCTQYILVLKHNTGSYFKNPVKNKC